MTANQGLAGRLDKLRSKLHREGLKSLLAWAWRWIYWNILRRLLPARSDKRLTPAICEDLRDWYQRHPGAHYEVIRPAHVIVRSPVRTVEPAAPDAFKGYYRLEAPPKALVTIPGARLAGPNGLLVLPDGSFVGELIANGTLGRRLMLEKEPAYYTALPRSVVHKPGVYFPMFVIGWQNYYHWNHDVITRMHAILERLPQQTRFIVPAQLQPFQSETLRLIGIDPDRQIPFSGEEVWRLETTYLTIPYPKPAVETAEPLMWYRERCFSGYALKPGKPSRRLYISRRFARYNRYRNEAEVISCLAQFGFETVMPEQLPFREQVALFAEAEAVVGDGAGMVNTMFMQAGTRVLNIHPVSEVIASFWPIAEALGMQCWYLTSEIATDSDPTAWYPDSYVSISNLRQSVEAMLAGLAVGSSPVAAATEPNQD